MGEGGGGDGDGGGGLGDGGLSGGGLREGGGGEGDAGCGLGRSIRRIRLFLRSATSANVPSGAIATPEGW